jgi:disulfide bond formation protein DsbB
MLARTESVLGSDPVPFAAAAVAIIGAAAILGAFFFQYVVGIAPCPLCLEQRIAYYVVIPLAVMVLVGTSVNSNRKVLIAALLFIAAVMIWNTYLGTYHAGVEWKWWPGPTDCTGDLNSLGKAGNLLNSIQTSSVVRCDQVAWSLFGISLAGFNAMVSLVMTAIAAWGGITAWRRMPAEG